MINVIVKILVKSPLYPHWLEHLKMRQADSVSLKGIRGKVIEVGAGDGRKKAQILSKYPSVKSYLSTDYSSWDNEFKRFGTIKNRFGKVGETFMGRQTRSKLDAICSATDLPYPDNKFDVHLSFEVLEHINDPFAYFYEASRVVKPSGKVIFSVPFLYREHKNDYLRFTRDFLKETTNTYGLKVVFIYSNTGLGTTVATLTNQWLIRRTLESKLAFRLLFFTISPVFFVFFNIVGFLIDLKPDPRFATRYHVVLKKL